MARKSAAKPLPLLISLVVPVHNEEDSIDPFLERTVPILDGIVKERGPDVSYEILFVDDGSRDSTLKVLEERRKADGRISIITLSRNFGKDQALAAGLAHAAGETVVPIDVDLQDPPELIPDMIAKWAEGYDVVYAARADRSTDSWAKRFTARQFYRIFNAMADRPIPQNAGDFRLLSRDVVEVLNRFPERARFMKGLFAWVGFRQCSLPFSREQRAAGETSWSYWKLWNFAIDGITSSTTVPLRIWSYVGAIIAFVGFAYAGFLILRTLIYGVDVPGFASLVVLILFFGGVNLLSVGILGEYLGRTYTEVKGRPLYIIREMHGVAEPAGASRPSLRTAVRAAESADERDNG
ncbi:MAG TPA: glycosyltransferase family 2 protein [Afifellaceae bacterium]|nr:glycosyltransferase family 2 protein [Afifellaceae bacterium]